MDALGHAKGLGPGLVEARCNGGETNRQASGTGQRLAQEGATIQRTRFGRQWARIDPDGKSRFCFHGAMEPETPLAFKRGKLPSKTALASLEGMNLPGASVRSRAAPRRKRSTAHFGKWRTKHGLMASLVEICGGWYSTGHDAFFSLVALSGICPGFDGRFKWQQRATR
jgi:hypothetical protein